MFTTLGSCRHMMVWVHTTSLTPPPLYNEVHVPSQESNRSCICALGISILTISTICFIEFWNCSDSVVYFVSPRIGIFSDSVVYFGFPLITDALLEPCRHNIIDNA